MLRFKMMDCSVLFLTCKARLHLTSCPDFFRGDVGIAPASVGESLDEFRITLWHWCFDLAVTKRSSQPPKSSAFCNSNSASPGFGAPLEMALLKSLVVLSAWRLVEGLAPGDCAFVGIYGDDDDFALVLMEDVNAESISLTEGSPADADFHIDQWAAAKHYVSDFKKGSVLKKTDFETDSASFLAPMALSAFHGNC